MRDTIAAIATATGGGGVWCGFPARRRLRWPAGCSAH